MALDLADIRAGLAARLATVSGLNTYKHVPGDLTNLPAAVIYGPDGPEAIDYDLAFGGGLTEVRWRFGVFTSKTLEAAGQALLDEYLSAGTGQTKSVVDAIYGDRTLGGTVDHARVELAGSFGLQRWNETTAYYGAELVLVCRVSRK